MSNWLSSDNTENKWVVFEDGSEFISNRVYKLYCRYQKIDPRYGGAGGRIHVARWVLQTNATAHKVSVPFLSPVYENATIASVRRKYKTAEAALARIAQIKALYAPYFTKKCPPIPPEYLPYFMVDGKLPRPFKAEIKPDPAER